MNNVHEVYYDERLKQDKGLALWEAPTASGKSWSMMNYCNREIEKEVKNNKEEKQYIIIAPQRNILDEDWLKIKDKSRAVYLKPQKEALAEFYCWVMGISDKSIRIDSDLPERKKDERRCGYLEHLDDPRKELSRAFKEYRFSPINETIKKDLTRILVDFRSLRFSEDENDPIGRQFHNMRREITSILRKTLIKLNDKIKELSQSEKIDVKEINKYQNEINKLNKFIWHFFPTSRLISECTDKIGKERPLLVLLTADKYFYPESTPYKDYPMLGQAFHNTGKIKIKIFIDESDAVKQRWREDVLKQLNIKTSFWDVIKSGEQFSSKSIERFRPFYTTYTNEIKDNKGNIIKRPEAVENEKYKEKIKQVLKEVKNRYSNIIDNFPEAQYEERRKALMDANRYVIFTGENTTDSMDGYYYFPNEINGCYIRKAANKEEAEKYKDRSIYQFTHKCISLLKSICKLVRTLINCMTGINKGQEEYKDSNELDYSYFSTVLTHTQCIKSYDGSLEKYIRNNIFYSVPKEIRIFKKYDVSIYNRGPEISEMDNNVLAATRTEFLYASYYLTPEMMLYQAAMKASIICISATALFNTCSHNFQLSYLEDSLGTNFHKPSDKEKENLRKYLEYKNNYSKVSIDTAIWNNQLLDCRITDKNSLLYTEAKKAEDNIDTYLDGLDIKGTFKKGNYHKEQLRLIGKAYIYHIWKQKNEPEDYDAALLIRNAFLNSKSLNSEIGYESCYSIIEKMKKIITAVMNVKSENYPILQLRSRTENQYEENILSEDDLQDKFKNNLKKHTEFHPFVITAYNSMGRGVNLQYPFDDKKLHTEIVGGHPAKENDIPLKDYDSIYLEPPTNIIPNLYKNDPHNGITPRETIISFTYLLEEYHENGTLAKKDVKTFHRLAYDHHKFHDNKIRESNDYLNAIISIYLQAMGRIQRSGRKVKTTQYFFSNRENKNSKLQYGIFGLAQIQLKDHVISIESTKVIKKCQKMAEMENISLTPSKQEEINRATILGQNKCDATGKYISRFLKDFNDIRTHQIVGKDAIDISILWDKIREISRSYKRKSLTSLYKDSTIPDSIITTLFIELPRNCHEYYWKPYNSQNFTGEFSFLDNNSNPFDAVTADLHYLFQIEGLGEYLKQLGYPNETTSDNDRYLINPVAELNFTRGILGEDIAKWCFEKYICSKEEINDVPYDKIERADFIANGIPVDAKFWGTASQADTVNVQERLKSSAEKAKDLGTDKYIIFQGFVNSDTTFRPKICNINGVDILTIPGLYHLKNKHPVLDNNMLIKTRNFYEGE